jgi:LemA protein
MSLLLIGGVVLLVLIVVFVFLYYFNRIYLLSNRIDNAWAQIDVQLKKRTDLVPNLIETVKGYMKHEKKAIEMVTKSRERMMKAGTPEKMAKADTELAGALKTIFALAENYPNLKANENFMMLQEELAGIENKIAYARQFYNDSVLRYNNVIVTIPGRWFASFMGRNKQKPYFEVAAAERKPVKVKFE